MIGQDDTQVDAGVSQDQPAAQPDVAGQIPSWGPEQFDSQQFGLDYKGQKVFPNDAVHLKNLAQQGYSYNTKMEELNNLKGQYDKEQQEFKDKYSKYDELHNLMLKHPDLNNQVWGVLNNFQGGGQTNGQTNGSYNPEYDEKFSSLQNELKSLKEVEEDRVLRETIGNIRNKYPDHPWDTDNGDGTFENHLLSYAHKNGYNTDHLEDVYKAFTFDQVRNSAVQQGAKQVAGKVQAQRRQGIVEGNPSVQAPVKQKFSHEGKSWDEIKAAARASI